MWAARVVLLLFCLQVADFSDPPCIIDLECAECIPDNMPMVTSHSATNGSVLISAGDEVTLACGGGRFLMYPLASALAVVCEAGRYRVRHDHTHRHIVELGCQENVFEDVLHTVAHCAPPLQGRAYRTQAPGAAGAAGAAGHALHLGALCFDPERARPVRLHGCNAPHNRLALPRHEEHTAPLSILGNFNHMFDAKIRHDAEKLYSDDVRLNRRLHELFKHEHYSFAEQSLTSGKLLSGRYFEDQNMRVTEFVSNRVASWKSIVKGNLHHLHEDVAKLMKKNRGVATVDVYAGTHGVLSLNTGEPRPEVYLMAGKRFPIPKYIWTVVHSREQNKGLAIILLNDPFVTVSEIREAVFCESACGSAGWLTHLRRHRNYERPVAGLVFCCALQDFVLRVPDMPSVFNTTVRQLF